MVQGGTLQITGTLGGAGSAVELAGAVTLDGAGTGKLLEPVIVTAAGATIENITIQTTSTTDGVTLQSGADSTTITGTTITGNQNGIVANQVGGLQLTGDTVIGNNGMGLDAYLFGAASTISSSLFAGNQGTGINLQAPSVGSLLVANSTVADNLADGIAVAGGLLTLEFDTVAFNAAGVLNSTILAIAVTAQDSLFADNTSFDYQGKLTSLGNNLIQTRPGAAAALLPSDLPNRPALLAPLGTYGTANHPPLARQRGTRRRRPNRRHHRRPARHLTLDHQSGYRRLSVAGIHLHGGERPGRQHLSHADQQSLRAKQWRDAPGLPGDGREQSDL